MNVVDIEKKVKDFRLQPLVLDILGHLLDLLRIQIIDILGQANDMSVPGILDRRHHTLLDVCCRLVQELLGLLQDRSRRV